MRSHARPPVAAVPVELQEALGRAVGPDVSARSGIAAQVAVACLVDVLPLILDDLPNGHHAQWLRGASEWWPTSSIRAWLKASGVVNDFERVALNCRHEGEPGLAMAIRAVAGLFRYGYPISSTGEESNIEGPDPIGDQSLLELLAWIFAALRDDTERPQASRRLVAALNSATGEQHG